MKPGELDKNKIYLEINSAGGALSPTMIASGMWCLLLVCSTAVATRFGSGSQKDRVGRAGSSANVQGFGLQRHVNQGWHDLEGVFKAYEPFLSDPPYIMYWRPQKVGSSTILSLLTSYAFRYNILAKLRSSQNYMCRKMAKCALEHLELEHRNATGFSQYAKHLRDYINGLSSSTHHPGNRNPVFQKRNMLEMERISELVGSYRISTNHEICNLDSDLVREQLPCAFSGVAVAKQRGHIYGNSKTSILDASTPMTRQNEAKWRKQDVFASALQPVPATAVFKEIFVVRHPLSRAVSVYYFWGELFKLGHVLKQGKLGRAGSAGKAQGKNKNPRGSRRRRRLEIKFRLGQDAIDTGMVKGPLFTYHGNESTVPPLKVAVAFADRLPYIAGMPGPSYTWSAFANSKIDAEAILKSDRIMTIVTERLDESLVVARHYLNWPLADVVVTKVRKALSKHPKYPEWPKEAITKLNANLKDSGEMDIYETANKKLDERIESLTRFQKINVTAEVLLLQKIRFRVSTICLEPEYLERYRAFIEKQGFPQHSSENKLRDAEDIYTEQGHAFGYNRDILYSYDVCGNCEAHAIEFQLKRVVREGKQIDVLARVDQAALLKDLRKKRGEELIQLPEFLKCP